MLQSSKLPLAGAILSGEIFYKHDFEAEAMIPGFVASTVSYSIVGFVTGWQPIFSTGVNPVAFTHPEALVLYGILGVVCAAFAHLLFKVYFRVNDMFERLRIPGFVKPAIGGLVTGVIGIFVPSVLGVGYGWAQLALNQNYQILPPTMILLAVFAEIFAMSFTLGSGGSGGIFGPMRGNWNNDRRRFRLLCATNVPRNGYEPIELRHCRDDGILWRCCEVAVGRDRDDC